MKISFFLVLTGFGAVAAACASLDSADSMAGSENLVARPLPCDVDAVLARACRTCHGATPSFGAPMSLVDQDDMQKPSLSDPSKKVYQKVLERVHATTRPMPPSPNPLLSSADLAILDRWVGAGAAAGTATCDGADGGSLEPHPLSCAPDQQLKAPQPWEMPATTDEIYMCFGFDVTSAQKRHIVGIAPKIDNHTIVHHLLLYQADRSFGSTPRECGSGVAAQWKIVSGWAPGGGNVELPPEAGIPQEETTHYVLQIHYNNVAHHPNQRDNSGFELCTTDQLRPHDADTMAFGTMDFSIPPRSATDLSCDFRMPSLGELHMFGAFPHMHTHGVTIQTTKLADGDVTAASMGGQSAWDFQSQTYQPIDAIVRGGDTIRTRCAWKNESDTAITYGELTSDEMCFSFTLYWPKITAAQWSPWYPASRSTCSPTQH